MTYPRAVLLIWTAALLLACLLAYDIAHAEGWYVEGGLGMTNFQRTVEDGTWWQEGLPHSWDTHDTAWKLCGGYQFERWALSGCYVSAGVIKNVAGFVGDEDYDPKNHVCLRNCNKLSWLEGSDAIRLYELAGTYRWHWGEAWSPFAKVGGALMTHRLTIANGGVPSQQYYGRIPSTALGAGLCYKLACVESTYYHGLGGMNCYTPCGFPLSKELFVTLFTLKWEFERE